MTLVATYLQELRDIRSSGANLPETSYYTPLANLLNEIGKSLKPKVRCIMGLKNQGAGMPDGGLFTADQFRKVAPGEPILSQVPALGVIEAKSVSDDAWVRAESPQVSQYWDKYRKVLVTNYRDFLLIGQDPDGRPVKLESFRLAKDEAAFWVAASHPQKSDGAQGERFIEYLKRVILHLAPLAAPEDVAKLLASYARDARARIEHADLPALAAVRSALEDGLGMRFEGDKGEHFFRSTLVQTLFYGVFSAWVLWCERHPNTDKAAPFDWRMTPWWLHVPTIKSLFEQIATPSKLGPLGLVEVLDWTGTALNRVDRSTFFSRFEPDHAISYFYEPFLEAYDPQLRKELGVWYTPSEVVQYMVGRVDTVLREELHIEDGLADPYVYVLDPCCGTGTYLVEVLKRIHATLKAKDGDALLGEDLRHAAKERIFGFEIMPAPFVIAHWQLGLMLQRLGGPLIDADDRVGVYLTNSLTGWEPPDPVKEKVVQLHLSGMPELQVERDAARRVKRDVPILVILGNPPYNAFAGVSPAEEQGLVDLYKVGLLSDWEIRKYNLDDLYVRFFRLSERRIADQTGVGVVCYISNSSYLNDPSYVVMRQRFLSEFDALWLDNLNGDSRETGKLTPDGKPDPSVFSTTYNREGIRLGTAVGTLVRRSTRSVKPVVRYRQFWGATKREDLLASLQVTDFNAQYEIADPNRDNRFSFRPSDAATRYRNWPKVVELCDELPVSGLEENRGGALMDMDRDPLVDRMRVYFDAGVDWETAKALGAGPTTDAGRFDAKAARAKVLAAESFREERVIRYALHPLDHRWCYHSRVRPIWCEPRPSLVAQSWRGNRFFIARMVAERPKEGVPIMFTSVLPDKHLLRPNAVAIPVRLRVDPAKQLSKNAAQMALLDSDVPATDQPKANLSTRARDYLASVGIYDPDRDVETAELVWMHALAVGYSPSYLAENTDGVQQDWPRVPLPECQDLLVASAKLGQRVAALVDMEKDVAEVTGGTIRPDLRPVGVVSRVDGQALKSAAGDLDVRAGWGHPGKDGVVMPGRGRIVHRPYSADELAAMEVGGRAVGLPLQQVIQQLGDHACDVYLNDVTYWRNVPIRAWEYTVGGYQVMKKWLSYREYKLLERSLSTEHAREFTSMARRIAAILLLEPELDNNYQKVKAAFYTWGCPSTTVGPGHLICEAE